MTSSASTALAAASKGASKGFGSAHRGEMVTRLVELSPGQSFGQAPGQSEVVIRDQGADFIKLHFAEFRIPEGAYVEVSNPTRSELYRYGHRQRDAFTADSVLGEDGATRWASMSITGDTVHLALHLNRAQWISGHHRVLLRGYLRGVVDPGTGAEADAFSSRSTCGGNQRRDVACYESSHPVEYERAKPVARLVVGGLLCTAWHVGAGNRFLTNNHCMSTPSSVSAAEVWFNYQRASCGGGGTTATVKVTADQLLHTDSLLDYTLFTVNNLAQVQAFGYLGLDVREAVQDEEIYIPQHGSGNPKELAIESDQNPGSICRVDQPTTAGRGPDTDVGYYCDTIGGSSGSPVLSRSSHNVVALHHYGGCPNSGVKMARIWPQIAHYFADEVPGHDAGNTGPNQPPVAAVTSVSNGLRVDFTSFSSDADGALAKHQWYFGDGNTAIAENPEHVYEFSGTYPVTLSVLDDRQAPATVQTQLTVVQADADGVIALGNGIPLAGISGASGTWRYFSVQVPQNARNLSLTLSRGSGNADLYTRFAELPTSSVYDCRPRKSGNNESCFVENPQAGTYLVGVFARAGFADAKLRASYLRADTDNGITATEVSGYFDDWQYFAVDVPFAMSDLEVTLSGGSGDADLYLNYGVEPDEDAWLCSSEHNGNLERCSYRDPRPGRWYIGVRAYTSFSGLTVDGHYYR